MRGARLAALAFIITTGIAGSAWARSLYLNGVKLDAGVSVPAQTFVGCDVRFDDKGDVWITAKGYKLSVTNVNGEVSDPRPSAPAPSTSPAAGRGFWLITKQTERGAAQYDVDVYINNALVKKIKAIDDPTVFDVSKWVQPGSMNHVRMVAMKNTSAGPGRASPTDTLQVILGEGTLGGGTVTVDKVHVSFVRNATEAQNIQQEFDFRAP